MVERKSDKSRNKTKPNKEQTTTQNTQTFGQIWRYALV